MADIISLLECRFPITSRDRHSRCSQSPQWLSKWDGNSTLADAMVNLMATGYSSRVINMGNPLMMIADGLDQRSTTQTRALAALDKCCYGGYKQPDWHLRAPGLKFNLGYLVKINLETFIIERLFVKVGLIPISCLITSIAERTESAITTVFFLLFS